MEETLQIVRTLVNGRYHSVHTSADGNVTVDAGEDDQRPDSDGITIFRPTMVAQMIGTSVYRYLSYCGACGYKMEGIRSEWRHCPACGVWIGHYVFAMGYQRLEQVPDFLLPTKS